MTTKVRRTLNKINDNVRMLLDIYSVRAHLLIDDNPDRPYQSGEEDHDVVVRLSCKRGLVSIKLTSCTGDELNALKEFWDIAFANAQPIVELRDKIAQEAMEHDGDDSYTRLYRPLPRVVVREGSKWANYPSLRRGLEWVASLDSYVTRRVVNLRGSSSEVPDSNKARYVGTDYSPSVDGLSGVREVGGPGSDLGGLQQTEASEG